MPMHSMSASLPDKSPEPEAGVVPERRIGGLVDPAFLIYPMNR